MHSSLRSLNFWRVIIVDLLVSVFVYMLMPLWPGMLHDADGVALQQSGTVMLCFCLGLFLPGAVSSYLLDRYRRKDVCFWSIIVLFCVSMVSTLHLSLGLIALCRLLQGAAFALFHTALGSTILIDITISERRDVASYIYFWVCRFALAIGPALGVLLLRPVLLPYRLYVPIGCALLAIYFIVRLQLPFRTPLRSNVFSLDRFLLRHSLPLCLLLVPVPMTLGAMMAVNLQPLFFVYLLGGFFLSLVLHFMVYYHADVRAEIVTGLLTLMASFLLLLTQDVEQMVTVSAVLAGYGVGCVSGRLQSFFTVVSKHTERGSAQVTYKLTFEGSLCVGFFLPCLLPDLSLPMVFGIALGLNALALAFYLLYVHPWFMRNNRR